MIVRNKTPKLLCEKYWENQIKIFHNKTLNTPTVRDHRYIMNLNLGCLLNKKPEKHIDNHKIKSIDTDFKYLPKLENDIVLWRGIPKYHPLQTSYFNVLYNNIESLNRGDIYVNRAYMFGAVQKLTAEVFRHNWYDEGLLIKMDIPKGAQVSLTDFEGIMPRYSKWICLNKEPIENGYLVELEYIPPDNKIKNNSLKTKVINFVNSIKTLCRL